MKMCLCFEASLSLHPTLLIFSLQFVHKLVRLGPTHSVLLLFKKTRFCFGTMGLWPCTKLFPSPIQVQTAHYSKKNVPSWLESTHRYQSSSSLSAKVILRWAPTENLLLHKGPSSGHKPACRFCSSARSVPVPSKVRSRH